MPASKLNLLARPRDVHVARIEDRDLIFEAARRHSFAVSIDDRTVVDRIAEERRQKERQSELGGEIWMDIHSRLDHVGAFVFRGDLSTQVSNLDPAP